MRQTGKRLWALALCASLLLGAPRAAANTAVDGNGIEITAETGDTTYTFDTNGRAEWVKDTKTLTLRGTGTIEIGKDDAHAIYFRDNSNLVVASGANIKLKTTGSARSPLSAENGKSLNITVQSGASLTAENSSTGENLTAVIAPQQLEIDIAQGGSMRAVSNGQGGRGLHSDGKIGITNNGTLSASGLFCSIFTMGDVTIDGTGSILLSGKYGVYSYGNAVEIKNGIKGMIAGGETAVRFSAEIPNPGFTNNSSALLALDRASAELLAAMAGTSFEDKTAPTGGLDLTGVAAPTLYTNVGGGAALWDPGAKTLTLSGTVTIATSTQNKNALALPGGSMLAVAGGTRVSLETSGDGLYPLYATDALDISVGAGASLTAENATTGTAPSAVQASGALDVTVAANGSLRAVSKNTNLNSLGLNSLGTKIQLDGGATLSAAGTGYGIHSGNGSVSITGTGAIFASGGTGIRAFGGTIDIENSVRGLVAGGGTAVGFQGSNSGSFTRPDALLAVDGASAALLAAMKDDTLATNNTALSGSLDLTGVTAPTLYTSVGGGAALWEPGPPHRLYLSGAGIASGGLALPAGETAILLSGSNSVAGGVAVAVTPGTDNALSLSGASSLEVTGGSGLPFTGVSSVSIVTPKAGYYATAQVVTGGAQRSLPGSVFRDATNGGTDGVYTPASGDTKFTLQYAKEANLGSSYLLTVQGGSGGGVYATDTTVTVAFAGASTDPFYGWEKYIPSTGISLGIVSAQRSFDYTMPGAHAALRPLLTDPNAGTGGGSGGPSTYTVVYKANYQDGPADLRDGGHAYNSRVIAKSASAFPAPEGMVFAGWAETADGGVKYAAGASFQMPAKTLTLYAVWTAEEAPPPVPGLNRTDHMAYLQGRPGNLAAPEAPVTREELAAILFRLLDADGRKAYETSGHSFPDVEPGRWSETAVATLARAGIFQGQSDGRFAPERSVTRAELAAALSRLDHQPWSGGGDRFPDAAGHWAAEAINRAAARGWVRGTPDGLFAPDRPVTRAEAAAVLNRVLGRAPQSPDDLLPGMRTFADNMDPNAWYYLDIQEAANGHDYTRKEDGVHEAWTALTDAP